MKTNSSQLCGRRAAPARRSPRAGFTLLELMVAGTAGMIVISTMYAITGASTHYFREQQRISNMQSSLRFAMDQLRRDIGRAGFGASPNSQFPAYQPCQQAGNPIVVRAIAVDDAFAPSGAGGLIDPSGDGHQIDGAPVQGDRLQLMGNYSTSGEYRIRNLVGNNTVTVDPATMTFTRDFTGWPQGDYAVQAGLGTAFVETFWPTRLVRVRAADGSRFFSQIANANPGANPPQVTLANAIAAQCAGFAGGTVNPVSIMQYTLVPAAGNLAHLGGAAAAAGQNVVLVRRELDTGGGPLFGMVDRVIAERVVHFNVDLLVNQNLNRQQVAAVLPEVDGVAQATTLNLPEHVFSAIVTLAVRTPLADNRFPWIAQAPGEELTRFRFNQNGAAASRVRVARAEIFLPNVAYEWTN